VSLENDVRLSGNLARDPEVGRSATTMVRMTVAVNSYNAATKAREADFIGVVCFGKTAEFVQRYFTKGSGIILRGHLKPRSWTDPKTGEKKYETSIVADEVGFPPKSGGATGAPHAMDPGATPFDEGDSDPFSLV
jgi:single-strand DNA-binding protein